MRDAVVRRHGARASLPRSLVHGSERVGLMGWKRLSDHRLEERASDVVLRVVPHRGGWLRIAGACPPRKSRYSGGVNPDAGAVVLHGKSPATRTSFLSAGPVGPVEATRTLAEDIDTAVLSTSSRWRTLRPWTSPPVLRRSSPPRRHQPGPCRSATTASCPTAR